MSVYNNILNDEVLKTPWFIYIDEKKEFHKIYEGTAPEILNNGCGHFEETSIEKGNIALEKKKETDFSKIDRKDRILTLITCIENEREYRLCVTAKEIF